MLPGIFGGFVLNNIVRGFQRNFFAPPTLVGDEEYKRRAFVLHVLTLVFGFAALIVAFIEYNAGNVQGLRTLTLAALVCIVVNLINRRGYVAQGAMITVLTMLAVTTQLAKDAQGIHDIAILVYPVTLIVAAMLLTPDRLILALIGALLAVAYLVFGEIYGWITLDFPSGYVQTTDFLVIGVILIVTTVAMRILMDDIWRSLQQARRNEALMEEQANLRRQSEKRWRALIEYAPAGMFHVRHDGKILFFNQSARYGNNTPEGRFISEILPPDLTNYVMDSITQVLESQHSVIFDAQFHNLEGEYRWHSVRISRVLDDDPEPGVTVFVTETEVQKIIEHELRVKTDQLSALMKIGNTVSSLQDVDVLLRTALEVIRTVIPLDAFYIATATGIKNMVRYLLMYDAGQFWPISDEKIVPGGLLDRVLRAEETILWNRTPEEIAAASRARLQMVGDVSRVSASMLLVPLVSGAGVTGVISAQSYEENCYTDSHLDFLRLAANEISIALENARLYASLQNELVERIRADRHIRELNQELEERVRARTADLEEAVHELEGFSYTISHDLRAPIRGVSGFTAILEEQHGEQLDEVGRYYLGWIKANAAMMGRQIDDLLAFIHLARMSLNTEQVNMTMLASEVAAELSANLPHGRARFYIEELPPIQADPSMVRLLLSHLVENGLKFAAGKQIIEINIGYLDVDGKQTYFVRDNGVGFDMQYAGKLFQVFQRLHLQEEFEGSGVGLAMVRRILNRHGGDIWAESVPGEGATFYFTFGA